MTKTTHGEESVRVAALPSWRRLFSLALLLSLLLLLPACATVSAFSMPGPVNDEAVQVDMKRTQVESVLNQMPNSMLPRPDGMFEARYEYEDGPSGWTKLRTIFYLAADMVTLGLSEVLFWPTEIAWKKRIGRVAVAEYTPSYELASWMVTGHNGEVLLSEKSANYDRYLVAARSSWNGTRQFVANITPSALGSGEEPLIAPPTATTQRERVRFSVRVRDTTRHPRVRVDGEFLRPDENGSVTVEKIVPMGESTILLAAVDNAGQEHVQNVSVTRWDPSDEIPSALRVGRFFALVIGNNAYVSLPPLKTARADANAVAYELEAHYGYEVNLLLDATRHDIVSALAEYRNRLTSDDKLLVYYAGHGIEDKIESHGYWLPIDAEAENPSEWIANANITRHLRAMSAKHVMVVADSCYAGTLTRGIVVPDRTPGYLERLAGRRSRTVMTSGGIEPVSDSGSGANSVFAGAFLYELRSNQGLLEANELFLKVRRRVAENAEQTPQYAPISKADHGDGEFLFLAR